MSIASDILSSIERRAERAIAQELHLMIEQILKLRAGLVLAERNYADGLLLKLDRLHDDQVVRTIKAPDASPTPHLDELVPLSPSGYEVRFFDREYGDLEDVVVVESYALAVQVAVDRHKAGPGDLTEADWKDGRGTLTVRSRHATVLLRIEAIESLMPTVQSHVTRACIALEHGEQSAVHQLFTLWQQVA